MIETDTPQPTRRDFAQALALFAVASGPPTLAQEPKKVDPATYAYAWMIVLRQRFGKILNDEQLKRVQQAVLGLRTRSDFLLRSSVTNGDDPIAAFSADA